MTVKGLIKRLLDMPMDLPVRVHIMYETHDAQSVAYVKEDKNLCVYIGSAEGLGQLDPKTKQEEGRT